MCTNLILLCLSAALVVIATSAAQPVSAAIPPAGKLSLESLPTARDHEGAAWVVVVNNGQVSGRQPAPARGVVVLITATANGQTYSLNAAEGFQPSHGQFDPETGRWTIPLIPALGSVEAEIHPARFFPLFTEDTPVRLHAELIDQSELDSAVFDQWHTEVEGWYVRIGNSPRIKWPSANVGVNVQAPFHAPSPGVQATLNIEVKNSSVDYSDAPRHVGPTDRHRTQWDVQVKVELSPGLSFVPEMNPPTGSFDPGSGIWNVGTISGQSEGSLWTLPVLVTNDDVPLEQRCLTATVVNAIPEFASDAEAGGNNFASACLRRESVVLDEGEVALWWLHDCVGIIVHPCAGADEILVLARVNEDYLEPETVVVQVQDEPARVYNSHANSINSGTTVSWQTKGAVANGGEANDGVQIIASMENLAPNSSRWATYGPETASLSGPNGAAAPGNVGVRFSPVFSRYFDLAPSGATARSPSFTDAALLTPLNLVFEFETLGTYVVEYEAQATDTGANDYSDSGVYVFHVGPIAELEIRDGGASPLAAPEQWAYTIQAVNNGPDAAPAPRVTLNDVPAGAESIPPGAYKEGGCTAGLCEGVWDPSGPLPITYGPKYPTLTLVTDADNPGPITASIANNGAYTATIDGTTHTGTYLDYITENSSGVSIVARAGASRSIVLQTFANFAPPLLQWESLERLHGWAVDHYEVRAIVQAPDQTCQRPAFDDDATDRASSPLYVDWSRQPGEDKCYAVRAVNIVGHKSHWYEPASTGDAADTEGPPVQVRTIVREVEVIKTVYETDEVIVEVEVEVPVLPAGATDLTATAEGEEAIALSWNGPDRLYDHPVGWYEVEASEDGGLWKTLEGRVDGESYTHRGLEPGSTRHYRVYAHNSEGRSLASDAVQATTEGVPPGPQSVAELFRPLIDYGLLTAVFHYDNATQEWTFFDPAPEFAGLNTLEPIDLSAEPPVIFIVHMRSIRVEFLGQTLYPGWNYIAVR